jgi:hypothetical protein
MSKIYKPLPQKTGRPYDLEYSPYRFEFPSYNGNPKILEEVKRIYKRLIKNKFLLLDEDSVVPRYYPNPADFIIKYDPPYEDDESGRHFGDEHIINYKSERSRKLTPLEYGLLISPEFGKYGDIVFSHDKCTVVCR